MTDAVAHRGPDARGTWVRGHVGLGHRRLSIIDLSPDANQPMVAPSGSVITFNGEIYNYKDLRRDLEREGVQFRTKSDTEVLLALYDRDGEACVDRLIGMFAFAIWDPARQRLFCARDRLGKKPLYYFAGEHTFSFASELAALLKDPEVPREMDPDAIHHYLTLHYVPSPMTAFVGVAKLPPAHTLVWERGAVTLRRYWTPMFEPKDTRDEQAICDELWALLRDSTKIRMLSDVPLGAFLSGGTDSSTIVAAMSEVATTRLKTFSIGFNEAEFNELVYAKQVAELYGTEHHELLVTSDAAAVLPQLVEHHGEPFSDPSSIPTYYLAKMTREHVTVALSGDGGDEVFGGYSRYVWAWMAGLSDGIPRGVIDRLRRFTQWIGRKPAAPMPLRLAAQHVSTAVAGEADRYLSFAGHFPPFERAAMYTRAFGASLRGPDTTEWYRQSMMTSNAKAPLDRYILNDLQGYLTEGIMAKVDIASMIHALEVRAPFLDHRIVELGARLPVELKQHRTKKRVLFKRAVAQHLPPAIVNRKKRGFGIPVEEWLRTSLAPMLRDLVIDGLPTRGIFERAALTTLVDDHLARRANHGHKLWNLMVLELWARRFLDDRPRSAAG